MSNRMTCRAGHRDFLEPYRRRLARGWKLNMQGCCPMVHWWAPHGPIGLIADLTGGWLRTDIPNAHGSASPMGTGTNRRSKTNLSIKEFNNLIPRSHVTYRCSRARWTLGAVRVPCWFCKFTSGHRTGPCGWLTELETSVWSVERAPYGHMQMLHGLANTRKIRCVGLYEAQWGPWVHVLIVYIRPNLSIAIRPVRAMSRLHRGLLRAQNHSVHVWMLCMLSPAYTGSKNNPSKIVRVIVRDPVKPTSARTRYIKQGKPEYVPFTTYRPCTAPEDCLGK